MREMSARTSQTFGIEERYPFLDKTLVEFCFSLPEIQLKRNETIKHILREALKDSLPSCISNREDKADFSFIGVDELEKIGGRKTFQSLAIYDLGWVDRRKVLALYDQMLSSYRQDSPAYIDPSWKLWNVFGASILVEHHSSLNSSINAQTTFNPPCI